MVFLGAWHRSAAFAFSIQSAPIPHRSLLLDRTGVKKGVEDIRTPQRTSRSLYLKNRSKDYGTNDSSSPAPPSESALATGQGRSDRLASIVAASSPASCSPPSPAVSSSPPALCITSSSHTNPSPFSSPLSNTQSASPQPSSSLRSACSPRPPRPVARTPPPRTRPSP